MKQLETSNTPDGHKMLLEKISGTRINIMDYAGIPLGWVIDARKNDPLWNFMKPEVFPLKPKPSSFDRVSKSVKTAQEYLGLMRNTLEDPNAFMVIIPDEDGGWEKGWVRSIDVSSPVDNETLFQEHLQCIREGNLLLADAKLTAFQVRTGEWDLH